MKRDINKDSSKKSVGLESILKPFIYTIRRAVLGNRQDIDAQKAKLKATLGESGIDIYSNNAVNDVQKQTVNTISKHANKKTYDGIAVLCVGAARGADNLGPMVGSILNKNHKLKGVDVYGTMEKPINGFNIEKKVPKILKKHKESFIIAIDCASTFKKERYGCIFIKKEQLRPGSGIGNEGPNFGDMIVEATLVHKEKEDNPDDIVRKIENTDEEFVRIAAEVISTGLHKALKNVTEKGIILLDRS